MRAEVATTNKELFLAAALMARPEFVSSLFPPTISGGDIRVVENPTARAAISVLATQGPAFSNPSAMSAALADLPVELDGDEVIALFQLIPHEDEVELEQLVTIKDELTRTVNRRQLSKQLILAGTELRSGTDDDAAVGKVFDALRAYQRGGVGKDATAGGILGRMGDGKVTIRWKVGCPLLDGLAQGIGPDGEFGEGIAGQGEAIIIAAKYGVGKTRLALNWLDALLDQKGSSIALLAGEDNEATYSAKMMGVRFGIEKWKIERYLVRRQLFLDQYGRDEAIRIEEAQQWYHDLGDRLRIYDGDAKVNIFKFPSALALLEEDKAVYGTTHVLVDYAQIWKGETHVLETYAQDLRAFGGRTGTGVIVLSQVSNETMKFGAVPGQLPAKGSGEWGQIAHFGYYLEQDPLIGQKELRITQVKGRDAGMTVLYAEFDEATGKVLRYKGTPDWMGVHEDPSTPAPKKGGRRK